jgi:hypothetical protein
VVAVRAFAALPPFDVVPPTKNPRRQSLQVSIMEAIPLSARDAIPTPTVFLLQVEVRLMRTAIALYSITRFGS